MTNEKTNLIIRLSKINTFITYHTHNFVDIERNSDTYRTAEKVAKKINELWLEAKAKGNNELNQFFDAETLGEIEAWGYIKR